MTENHLADFRKLYDFPLDPFQVEACEAVEAGLWQLFLLFLAGLNFFMGVFNLLPLLPLDGGHIAVTWYEHVRNWLRDRRGKTAAAPVDYTKLSGITMVLVMIGGAVLLLTVTADIVNPIRLQ